MLVGYHVRKYIENGQNRSKIYGLVFPSRCTTMLEKRNSIFNPSSAQATIIRLSSVPRGNFLRNFETSLSRERHFHFQREIKREHPVFARLCIFIFHMYVFRECFWDYSGRWYDQGGGLIFTFSRFHGGSSSSIASDVRCVHFFFFFFFLFSFSPSFAFSSAFLLFYIFYRWGIAMSITYVCFVWSHPPPPPNPQFSCVLSQYTV